jgi:hypothetical protein
MYFLQLPGRFRLKGLEQFRHGQVGIIYLYEGPVRAGQYFYGLGHNGGTGTARLPLPFIFITGDKSDLSVPGPVYLFGTNDRLIIRPYKLPIQKLTYFCNGK